MQNSKTMGTMSCGEQRILEKAGNQRSLKLHNFHVYTFIFQESMLALDIYVRLCATDAEAKSQKETDQKSGEQQEEESSRTAPEE